MYTGHLTTDLNLNALWMSWNIFLGCIPFLLAWHLFQPGRKISFFWTLGLVFFILFLPNAPYIFTDVIHFREQLEVITRRRDLVLATAQYLIFLAIGYMLFVESYRRFEKFILGKRYYQHRYIVRLTTFATVSFGVWLGRVLRFNSWDLFVHPQRILLTTRFLNDLPVITFILAFTCFLMLGYFAYESVCGYFEEKV